MKTQSHAIILAAGRGSRLGTITQDHPKCRTRLGGKSLLDWQLEALQGAGAESIGVVTGYLAEMLARHDGNEILAKETRAYIVRVARAWPESFVSVSTANGPRSSTGTVIDFVLTTKN